MPIRQTFLPTYSSMRLMYQTESSCLSSIMSKLKMPQPLHSFLAFFKCSTMKERTKLYANSSNFFAYLLFMRLMYQTESSCLSSVMTKRKMPRPLKNFLAFFKCLSMRERKKLYANLSNFFAYLLFYGIRPNHLASVT
jgi:hypothetical protein